MYESGSNPGPAAWLLVGATAVGKTAVAHYLAERLGSSILSTDAMLVYRGMDLGTAKPSRAERAAVRYLGIDLTEPDQPFSTGAWLQAVRAEVAAAPELRFAGTEGVPTGGGLLAVGGTGLYVRALTQGLECLRRTRSAAAIGRSAWRGRGWRRCSTNWPRACRATGRETWMPPTRAA
jgi:tRNA A37 N6-isopentenylltransferase MiaA